MTRRPPRSTRTYSLFPHTALFRPLEAHGPAIFGGSTSVANNGIVSLDRVCPVILVEDIATPAEDRPAAIRRAHAKPRGNERAAIHLVEILVRVGDGQNAQRFAL